MGQFSDVCEEDEKCISIVEEYSIECFDEKLALAAIEAKTRSDKDKINSKHILKYQECLTIKSEDHYWKNIDMVKYILSQVD